MCDMEMDYEDHKLCRGCLSSDRRLTSVTTNHFYYSLLTEEQKREVGTAPCAALCWECIAILRRIKKFQEQVHQTHTILQNCFGLYPAKPLLSSLGTSYKWDYDAIFEERNPNEQVDTIVTPTKYKALNTEMKVENGDDIKCEEIISDVKIEYGSDDYDYDDHDSFNACDTILNLPEITIKNRKSTQNAKNNTEQPIKRIPIVKTPALVKVEQELQSYIECKFKNQATTSKKECDKFNENNQNNDSYTSADDVPEHEENNPKRKQNRVKPESDPDFSFDEDNITSECNTKKDLNTVENSEKGINKKHKYRKVFTRYKDIADVISYFTEIKMSVNDFKSILEKEDAIVDNQKPNKCNVCGWSFEFLRFLKNHAVCHKKTHPGHFENGQFLNLPLPIPENPCLWRCSICSRMVRREHAVTHVDVNHRIRYYCTKEGCKWSQKFYWTREDHKEHLTAFHTQYLCDICGKEKKRRHAMETHMRQIHLKVLAVPCSHCELKFATRDALRTHVLLKHTNDPPELRYCVECDVTFPSVIQLDQHFNYKHKKANESFPCGDCGRVFLQKHSMMNHYNLIHKGKSNHQCNICGKYLSKKMTLARHLDSHNNIKLPYTKPCAVCGRMFQTKKALQNHMYTHTGERPYRCPHCDAAYTQPYCLKVHLKKQHGVNKSVGVKDAVARVTSLNSV